MTNQQILEKAIQKAIDNGWEAPSKDFEINNYPHRFVVFWNGAEEPNANMERVIFNHSFAEALWGEDERYSYHPVQKGTIGSPIAYMLPEWKVCLQQMVIAPDPIAYLGEHL